MRKTSTCSALAAALFAATLAVAPAEAAAATAQAASGTAGWSSFITEASKRFGVAEDWIKAVMHMESGGRTAFAGKPITSSAGAMGLMQLMPGTYEEMRAQYGLGKDPYDPHDNVLAGAAYLKWLKGKVGYAKMFAAYNAGPGTVETREAKTLPAETRAYVKGIARLLGDDTVATIAKAKPVPATLTRPDGSTLTIAGSDVKSLRAALPGEYAPGVKTVLAMGGRDQGVTEDLATVTNRLKRG